MGKGLEGVVAASTGISYIDGLHGRLFYRGIEINELAERSTFEETTALLWYGKLPTQQQLQSFERKFRDNRQIPNEILALLMSLPKKTAPMEVLRTAVSALASYDPDDHDNSLEANVHKSIRLTAVSLVAVLSVLGLSQAPASAKTVHHQSARAGVCCGS